MNVDNLNSFEKDQLLRWLLHYLPMGSEGPDVTKATRREFMVQFPAMYNKLVGREVVKVTQV